MASRLSVVVPIFNVEPYLDECLASLAAQTMGDFEVVMVDDGSTDGSAEIARAWEARDGRFRLVRKENAGLGPARNTGIEHISPESEFLAFVDSDDTLPPHAYELMLDTLDRTGSDFATGNVLRFRSTDHHQSPVHRRPFARTRLETHVSEFPPLITDRTAWNKVYRRSFWERHRLQYPPILYEDAPVSIPLHFLAEKVDVLAEHIYNWRERDSGTQSITQNRTNPQGLIDRVASIGMVREFLRNQADPRFDEFRHRYDRNALVEEIPLFFKPLRIAGAEFRTAYLDHVGRLVADIGPKTLNALPQPMRLKYYLTVKRRLDELLAMLEFERTYPYTIPMHGTLRPAADYPFLRAPVPAAVLRLDQELVVRTGLRSAQWTADGRLELTGFAYPRHAGATRPREALKMLVLRESGGRRRLAVPARTVRDPRITAEAWGQALRDCDYGGFEARIDPARLQRRGRWVDGMWRVTVGVLGPGRPRRSRLKGGPFDAGANPPARWVSERVRVVPEIHDAHLYLHVETVHAVADAAAPAADGFEIRGRLDAELAAQAELLVLQCQEDGGAAVQVAGRLEVGRVDDGWAPFTAFVDPALMAAARKDLFRLHPNLADRQQVRWGVQLLDGDGEPVSVVMAERWADRGEQHRAAVDAADQVRLLHFKRSPHGYLQIVEQPAQPVFDKAVALPAEECFALEGSFPLPGRHQLELVLRHGYYAQTHTHPAEAVDGRLLVKLPAVPNPAWNGDVPLLSGRWRLFVRLPVDADAPSGETGEEQRALEVRAKIAPAAQGTLPLEVEARGRTVRLRRHNYDALLLEVESSVPVGERGGFHRRRMREEVYPAARERPLLPQVLYDVFGGRDYADSPRAIHQEFLRRDTGLEHLWVVRDHRAVTPPGARTVVFDSSEWYEAYARSRFVVGNTHFPAWLAARPEQVVVQTWHGTPLKRIGFDFDNDWFADTDYLEELRREVPQWRLLLAPNRFSTPVFRRAFRYEGEILESGYPRNDLLLAPDRELRARRVREALGLPEGRRVVLYAPTWREDQARPSGGYQLDLRLDLPLLRSRLGGDHVLLVRPHAHVGDHVPGAGDGFVWDVGSYPDIADLYLVADVLLTDYSSTMFDFAVTGRPMLFFTYDLDRYRDVLRGFYFDFEAQAPGPLLATTEEVVDALLHLDRVVADSAASYAAFRARYCDLDDGQAARRVVDRMLELWRDGR